MRNRAKCKLCGDILESFHMNDYVTCKCGEISIDGGTHYLRVAAKNWNNFLRVDDEDNEIIPVIYDQNDKVTTRAPQEPRQLSRKELIDMLQETLNSIERLPDHAMSLPINHYDFYSFAALVLSILRSE